MPHEDYEPQAPVVGIGTTFDISGSKAKVVGITKQGVQVQVEGQSRTHNVDFAMIEHAVTSSEEEG